MWSRSSVVVMVLVVGALAAAPAAANELDPSSIDLDCTPTSTEMEDIASIAEQDGIDLDEAIDRYGWQTCFSEAVGYLQSTFPDTYAGAAVVDGGRGAWIGFTGEVPDEAVALTSTIPVDVELLGDRPFSDNELNEAMVSVYGDVWGHDDVLNASADYDLDTGEITIRAQPDDALDEAARAQLLASLQPPQPDNPAIAVTVVLVDNLGGDDDTEARVAQSAFPATTYVALLAAAAVLLVGLGWLYQRRRV